MGLQQVLAVVRSFSLNLIQRDYHYFHVVQEHNEVFQLDSHLDPLHVELLISSCLVFHS